MQPFHLARDLKHDFIDYVSSKFPFAENGDQELDRQLRSIMEKDGSLFQDPVLQLVRSRLKLQPNLSEFHPSLQDTIRTLPELRTPYSHQVKAWTRINNGLGTVISTGTGSGKSESFILPILNGLLQKGYGRSKQGTGAIFIYPMNALVHDQFYRIIKYAAGTGLRVGIYNGAFKDLNTSDRNKIIKEIDDIRKQLRTERPDIELDNLLFDPETLVVDPAKPETIPHILLTNYKMLEYMLLRSSDQKLFENMNLEYMVLDEAHTYTGTLALEIACLLNRLKVHLGDRGRNFVPVATSATLSQGPDQDEAKVEKEMRGLFTKLFGRPFVGDEWLLKDSFEPLIEPDLSLLKPLTKFNSAELKGDLEALFPDSLFRLAKRFAGIESNEYKDCAKKLHIWTSKISPHLLSVLLKDSTGRETNMVTWTEATERFKARLSGTPELLEALLVVCSHAFENELFPSIGLRYHLFGRAQPRVYWSLDKKTLFDDESYAESVEPALNFVSCRKCGHSAFAGLMVPEDGEGAERSKVIPLPERFDEEALKGGVEAAVLHDPASIPNNGEHLPGGWEQEAYILRANTKPIVATFSKQEPGKGEIRLVRYTRQKTSTKGGKKQTDDASDFHSCPACGETSDERPLINTHRSSASIDLSVHAASLLSKTTYDGNAKNDNKERKLLIFCDNRQETSFLAGFLTDRHRRLNLRRAVASYLKAAADAGDKKTWLLKKKKVSEDRSPEAHRFDFALRVLMSVEKGEFFSRTATLPTSFKIKKQTIQNLLPREVLQTDPRDRNPDSRKRALREWLLENYTIEDMQDRTASEDRELDLFGDSDKGNFVLELLTDVIALDLTAVQVREGSLTSLGLATWDFPLLNEESFSAYAAANKQLGLGGRALFLLSYWFIEKLATSGALADIDSNTAKQYLGRLWAAKIRPELAELLGKSASSKGTISKNSVLGRLLVDLGANDETLKLWANQETWREFIGASPLNKCIFLSQAERDQPVLKVAGELSISPETTMWRSTYTGAWRVSVPRHNFDGAMTGKKATDTWRHVEHPPHRYYYKLYHQSLASEARLVSAREHNGMISAADQNEAVTKFKEGSINTLVATPTLEMGVDLPDLPTVIHRSVPPDPSNYAQRAGRAGRGPKRALIFTYCGFSSHDMTFFESPLDMASGEILPPGMPVENTFIISRHLNGLVLEAMGAPSGNSPTLNLTSWEKLVDLTEHFQKAQTLVSAEITGIPMAPQDWRALYSDRKAKIQAAIDDFLNLTASNLWLGQLPTPVINQLTAELRQRADISSWPDTFAEELNGYLALLNIYLGEVEKLGNKSINELRQLSDDERRNHERAYGRALYFLKLYLGQGRTFERPQPISDMAASGFLPNFDFPGRVTRFRGVRVNNYDSENKYSDLLKYDRSATVALREFAPEQKIYGHGWVYEVERYIGTQNANLTTAGWGVCSNTCTELVPPEKNECPLCQSPVIRTGEGGDAVRPEIIEIREVHGSQKNVISDSSSRREMNYFTADLKLIGAPNNDSSKALVNDAGVKMHFHVSRANCFRIIEMVHRRDAATSNHMQTSLWREKTDSSSFAVRLNPPPPTARAQWRPFFPAVQTDCPGIRLNLPISSARANQWVQGLSDDPNDAHNQFYKTIAAAIERATQKVLRLNKRANHLEIVERRIMAPVANNDAPRIHSLEILILDTERGGSGIIPMIESYWDHIMDECSNLVLKKCCHNGCYRCLKSFDNQWDHEHIQKSVFALEGKAPVFESLKTKNWMALEVGQGQETDKNSFAESAFSQWLKDSKIPYKTQCEFRTPADGLITISDFEISTGVRRQQLFVDGWTDHGNPKTFLKDIEKRNFLAKRGWSVFWIPGHWPTNAKELEQLKVLVGKDKPLQVLRKKDKPFALPPFVEQTTNIRLAEGLSSDQIFYQLSPIDLDEESDPRVAILAASLNDLKKAHHPIAITSDDLVMCLVNGQEIMADKPSWNTWCTMQCALASLGYRVLVAWIGERPTGNQR